MRDLQERREIKLAWLEDNLETLHRAGEQAWWGALKVYVCRYKQG